MASRPEASTTWKEDACSLEIKREKRREDLVTGVVSQSIEGEDVEMLGVEVLLVELILDGERRTSE